MTKNRNLREEVLYKPKGQRIAGLSRLGESIQLSGQTKRGQACNFAILVGLQMGASLKLLSAIIGLSPSALSHRHDAARQKLLGDANTSTLASEIIQEIAAQRITRIAKSQA